MAVQQKFLGLIRQMTYMLELYIKILFTDQPIFERADEVNVLTLPQHQQKKGHIVQAFFIFFFLNTFLSFSLRLTSVVMSANMSLLSTFQAIWQKSQQYFLTRQLQTNP